MSIAGHALAAAGIAASALAALTLWLAARRRSAGAGSPTCGSAAAAGFWCLGVIAQQVLGAPLSGVAAGLTLADLPSLLALIAVVAGVAMLVAAGGGKAGDGWRTLGQRMARRPVIPRLADGFVLAAVLFVIGWIALFGPDYIRSGSGPGAFAVELLHPMAGLVAAALVLPMISDAGAAAVPPFVAVLLVTVSDALGVSARLDGGTPGAAQQASPSPRSACSASRRGWPRRAAGAAARWRRTCLPRRSRPGRPPWRRWPSASGRWPGGTARLP